MKKRGVGEKVWTRATWRPALSVVVIVEDLLLTNQLSLLQGKQLFFEPLLTSLIGLNGVLINGQYDSLRVACGNTWPRLLLVL